MHLAAARGVARDGLATEDPVRVPLLLERLRRSRVSLSPPQASILIRIFQDTAHQKE